MPDISSRQDHKPGRFKVRVECQRPPQTPHPHHLETDRIGQTQALLPEPPQPPVHGRALKVTIHDT